MSVIGEPLLFERVTKPGPGKDDYAAAFDDIAAG